VAAGAVGDVGVVCVGGVEEFEDVLDVDQGVGRDVGRDVGLEVGLDDRGVVVCVEDVDVVDGPIPSSHGEDRGLPGMDAEDPKAFAIHLVEGYVGVRFVVAVVVEAVVEEVLAAMAEREAVALVLVFEWGLLLRLWQVGWELRVLKRNHPELELLVQLWAPMQRQKQLNSLLVLQMTV